MKRNFFLLALLIFTPLYAFGDYIPGRVRESAKADLQREDGNGRYRAVQSAHVDQFHTDGRGITSFRIALDGGNSLPLVVEKIVRNRCGRTYLASFRSGSSVTEMRLEEVTPLACEGRGNDQWRASLTTHESQSADSQLVLSGVPEFLILTQ